MKKRVFALVLALSLLLGAVLPALASAPAVKETEYEGNGVVEVEFKAKRVTYKNAKVVVKDAEGKSYSAKIIDKDDDDLTFKVSGVKADTRYTYTLSGVRSGKSGSYGSVSGSFKTPADAPEIKKIEYDKWDKELEIEFVTKVQFKDLKVTVQDEGGKALTVSRVEKDSDEVELRVKGVEKGKKYTVTISGVRVKDKGDYTSVTGAFTGR